MTGPAAPPDPDLRVEPRRLGGTVPARLYHPPGGEAAALLVFAHGGGFSWGTLDDYDPICRRLALGTGSLVVSVDYRLAPAHRFPAGFDDLALASRWAAENRTRLVPDSAPLVVAGDSAGACLAAGVAQKAAGGDGPAFDGQLLIYPMLEYSDRTPPEFHALAERFPPSHAAIRGAWDAYLDPAGSTLPDFAVPPRTAELSGLCPALVLVAENDPLRFEALLYADKLRRAGIAAADRSYDGVAHGFLNDLPPGHPAVGAALAEIAAWIASL